MVLLTKGVLDRLYVDVRNEVFRGLSCPRRAYTIVGLKDISLEIESTGHKLAGEHLKDTRFEE